MKATTRLSAVFHPGFCGRVVRAGGDPRTNVAMQRNRCFGPSRWRDRTTPSELYRAYLPHHRRSRLRISIEGRLGASRPWIRPARPGPSPTDIHSVARPFRKAGYTLVPHPARLERAAHHSNRAATTPSRVYTPKQYTTTTSKSATVPITDLLFKEPVTILLRPVTQSVSLRGAFRERQTASMFQDGGKEDTTLSRRRVSIAARRVGLHKAP